MGDQDRTILRRFFIGLAAALIIFALAWVFFIRNTGKKDDAAQTAKPATSQGASTNTPGAATPKSGSSPSPATSSPAAPSQTGQPSNVPAPDGQKIVATGPGDTAALFMSITVISALAHHFYTIRKNRASSTLDF